MKKEMTLSARENERSMPGDTIANFAHELRLWLHAPAEWLRRYYSNVLEKEVTHHQASLITQSVAAFVLAAFPALPSVALHAACIGWFVVSLYRCHESKV